jgi:hypothetical protein
MFYRLMEACALSDAYPLEEVNDILRTFPQKREAIARTLTLFDPIHHAPLVKARALLAASDAGTTGGPEWLQPLVDALGANTRVYQLTHEGRTDHDWLDHWLADRLTPLAAS